MWIHENQDWPNFDWDIRQLAAKLGNLRHRQGLLLGQMRNLGSELKQEANLVMLSSDAIKSSAIEGVNLIPDEVRSSVARRLGLDRGGMFPSSRYVDGIVEMVVDASQNFAQPLTKKRLFRWHSALFPEGSGSLLTTVGGWRTPGIGPMLIVSGAYGKEKVHYEAPAAERLEEEMRSFLTWFEGKADVEPILKAGVAHLWFELIHPFEDGNGRIGRAVCDMALARADGVPDRYYSLSSQIMAERKEYYAHLKRKGRGSLDITEWLNWFLGCVYSAISRAEKVLSRVLFKARIWDRLNERQRLALGRMLEEDFEGFMSTSKYAKLAKCSSQTALRDIQDLQSKNILIQNAGGGRSTSYRLPEFEG